MISSIVERPWSLGMVKPAEGLTGSWFGIDPALGVCILLLTLSRMLCTLCVTDVKELASEVCDYGWGKAMTYLLVCEGQLTLVSFVDGLL